MVRKSARLTLRMLAAGAIGLTLTSAAHAQAVLVSPSPPTFFKFDAPAGLTSEPRAARKGQPLFTLDIHAERAVRLTDAIDMPKKLGVKRSLPAGEVLFAVFDGPRRVYCATATVKGYAMWGRNYPCLEDADGDGVFETASWRTASIARSPLSGIIEDGTMSNLHVTETNATPVKVRYVDIPYAEGPGAKLDIEWSAKGRPGEPVEIDLIYRSGRVRSRPMFANLVPGASTTVDCLGGVLELLGLDADGVLRYRIVSPPPPAREHVVAVPESHTEYIYY